VVCRSGSQSLRQVYFSTLDLALHSEYQAGEGGSVFKSEVVERVVRENTVMPPLPEDRFLNAFQHIFAGGYSAGEACF
jgi:oligopeptidase A